MTSVRTRSPAARAVDSSKRPGALSETCSWPGDRPAQPPTFAIASPAFAICRKTPRAIAQAPHYTPQTARLTPEAANSTDANPDLKHTNPVSRDAHPDLKDTSPVSIHEISDFMAARAGFLKLGGNFATLSCSHCQFGFRNFLTSSRRSLPLRAVCPDFFCIRSANNSYSTSKLSIRSGLSFSAIFTSLRCVTGSSDCG